MSTHVFIGGPADGVILNLARAPQLLRLVRPPDGDWTAIELLDDEVDSHEQVCAYRRDGSITHALRPAEPGPVYRPLESGPTDGQMRHKLAWQAWCRAATAKPKTLFPMERHHV